MAQPFKTYPLLLPFACLYGLGVRVRTALFDSGRWPERRFSLPLIGVGNLAVGGTGKTPHTEYLVRLLSPRWRTAVLSRGYGRRTRGFRLVATDDAAADVGDEPLQMKRHFPAVTVAVDADRCEGIDNLLDRGAEAPQVIVLDDVYQHRHVRPGLNILLTDYSRLYVDDCLLPAGRLREPAAASHRADVVIVTKCPPGLTAESRADVERRLGLASKQRLFFSTLGYMPPSPLDEGSRPSGSISLDGRHVLLVAGIARPQPLIDELQRRGAAVTPLLFADHHAFTPRDVRRITAAYDRLPRESRLIVTTEKDAARLSPRVMPDAHLRAATWVQPVGIRFVDGKERQFNQLIIDYVSRNSANSPLD